MGETVDNAEFEKIHDERITTFKKAFKDMIATSKAAYQKSDSKFYRERRNFYSKKEIERIVQEGDPIERASLSEFFFMTSGLYKRIILHYATFLTYAWVLVPYTKGVKTKINDKKVAQSYYDASDFCTTFQIDRKCALFAKDVLVKGAYYGLLHDRGDKIVIQDLPFDYCRSRFKNSEDIDIVEFNMAFFNTIRDENLRKEILETYPKVVQKGYYNFKYHSGPRWIQLPAEMGIYFNYFEERPFFLDLIPLIDDLDDYKQIDKERNLQALKRILVQKVPTDGMKLVFEPEEAEQMHNGALEMLSNNPDVDVLTTYTNVSLLDMSSDDDEKTEVEDVQDLIYKSAGVSKELFCATTDSGLNFSLNNDLSMMMILGQKFAHFFTVLLNYKFETKKVKFKLLIMPISYYNSSEYTSRAKDLAAFGYSFLTPILSTGVDQTNLAALKTLENDLLNLDEVLKPLQSAYTQSGKNQVQSASNSTTDTTNNSDESNNSNQNSQEEDEEDNNKNNNQGGEE